MVTYNKFHPIDTDRKECTLPTINDSIRRLYDRFLGALRVAKPEVTVKAVMREVVLSRFEEDRPAVCELLRIWARENFSEPPLWQSPVISYDRFGAKTAVAEMRNIEAIIDDPDLDFFDYGGGSGFFCLLEDRAVITPGMKNVLDELLFEREEEQERRAQALAGSMM